MNILVTGSNGFIGKNLIAALASRPDVHILPFDSEDTQHDLARHVAAAAWSSTWPGSTGRRTSSSSRVATSA